jgi:hypothetical protein
MDKYYKFKPVHKEVLQFIEDCKETDMELFGVDELEWEEIYLKGNCYFFAKQIKNAFPQAKILFNQGVGHAVAEVEGLLFDSRGLLTTEIEPSAFIESTPLFEAYAECWSYDGINGRPSDALYPDTLTQIVEKSAYDFVNEKLWNAEVYGAEDEDEASYILEDSIYEVVSNIQYCIKKLLHKPEHLEKAQQNGWFKPFDLC